jgi:hypothetical protein
VQERSHIFGSHIIEFLAIGTAVSAPVGGHRMLSPKVAVELEDQAIAADPRSLRGER